VGNDDDRPVSVSRRIAAPAGDIFQLLADPARHPELDGSGMLRPGGSNDVIAGVGDVFVMKMYFEPMGGAYEMANRIVTYETDRCIGWEPSLHNGDPATAAQMRNGSRWRFDLTPDGLGATVVTETYDCTNSPEQVRQAVDNGNGWVEAMITTLERLERLATNA
jgi:uncharacterized protein YndB with AHSA1/START domain